MDSLELLISALEEIADLIQVNSTLVHAVLQSIVMLLHKVKLTFDLKFNLNNLCVQICETVFKLLKSDWLFPFQAIYLLQSFYSAILTILLNFETKYQFSIFVHVIEDRRHELCDYLTGLSFENEKVKFSRRLKTFQKEVWLQKFFWHTAFFFFLLS